MDHSDIRPLSSVEIRAIEAKAHELRAEAFHDAALAVGTLVKSGMRALRFYLTRRELA